MFNKCMLFDKNYTLFHFLQPTAVVKLYELKQQQTNLLELDRN